MFLHKTNFLMRAVYPSFIWKIPSDEKKIYLTFDDGPIPEITEFVLENLQKYQAKATFFCIGDNIEKNPTIFKQIIEDRHSIGNHTFNHLNGWKTDDEMYLENVKKGENVISNKYSDFRKQQLDFSDQLSAIISTDSQISNLKSKFSEPKTPNSELRTQHSKALFRPPYGRIKRSQAKVLLPDYQIVMWDVLSGDYDQSISKETVLRKTLKYTEAGSIVLFHDSINANKNMNFALPRFLEYFSEKGFTFEKIGF